MNTKALQKQFSRIGARFAAKPHDAVSHRGAYAGWRRRVHEPELRTRGLSCVLVYEASFDRQLDVDAVAAPHSGDTLLLSIAWFNSRRLYLCRVAGGQLEANPLPDGAGMSLARHLEEAATAARRLVEQKQSRAKRQRRAIGLSHAAASERVELNAAQYDAYVRLLHACRGAKFLQDSGPVVAAYGRDDANTYVTALLRVAKCFRDWNASPGTWRAPSHNPAKSFASLLDHLFARYPTPAFLQTVWFRPSEDWIPCHVEVARGMNIRQVDALKFPLTRKMAHCLMQAPEHFTVEMAIRWGQVRGLGGTARTFDAISGARMTEVDQDAPEEHAFWQSVLAWLILHPMLAPGQYGPLIDFIRREKEQDASFQLAGRSPQVLLREMEQWHRELRTTRRYNLPRTWNGHGLDWCWVQRERGSAATAWRLAEITAAERLRMEGREMRHCVYSYAWECANGRMAIFSLQANGERALTVEYVPATRQIGEVRGKCNRVPSAQEWDVLRRWAEAKQIG